MYLNLDRLVIHMVGFFWYSIINKGEKVILIYAEDWGTLGRTNILRIQEIP